MADWLKPKNEIKLTTTMTGIFNKWAALAALLFSSTAPALWAETNSVTSPDGKLKVTAEDRDGQLYYTVD